MSKAEIAAFADKKWLLSHLEFLNKMYQISTGLQLKRSTSFLPQNDREIVIFIIFFKKVKDAYDNCEVPLAEGKMHFFIPSIVFFESCPGTLSPLCRATPSSYSFCFDGVEQNAVVAIGMIG